MEASEVVAALAALAQRSRLAVFRLLVERGPEGEFPGALSEALALAPATLSFHLKSLAHAGLVEAEPAGRNIRYRANFVAMQDLLAYLTRNCCGGDAALRARRSRPETAPMTTNPIRVLFVCTGNSARSVLSEATLNQLGRGRFIAYSAGSHPTGRVNPAALRRIASRGWPTEGYRSKSWDEFTGDGAPPLDIVVTVCDSAASETCPVYFGDFVSTHWGLPDPASAAGTDDEIDAAFAQAHRVIEHRVRQLVALPVEQLERAELRARLDAIGESLAVSLARRAFAEALGTATLLAIVVGSGIMGERLAQGNDAIALLANAIATGAGLYVLIGVLGPVSGAHFNPVVTLAFAWRRELAARDAAVYVLVQVASAVAGVVLAHAMFGHVLLEAGTHERAGAAQWLSEIVATAGLLVTILLGLRHRPAAIPALVAAWITAAYWFTASTSFANPAVTLARSLTTTFAGIRPTDAPGFIAAQLAGLALGLLLARALAAREADG